MIEEHFINILSQQVAPAELEALLMTHPAVADAAVIGMENELVGELPLAFVVKKPMQKVTAADLKKFVTGNFITDILTKYWLSFILIVCMFILDRVSSAKRLRGGVHFVEAIPRSPTGKILRRILRERIRKMHSKL